MDKSCHSSSADSSSSSISTTTTTTSANTTTTSTNPINNRDQYLRHLNKLSHKISKPTTSTASGGGLPSRRPPPPPATAAHPPPPPPPPPQQQQPPVYNINKSDFRDVVQKLTGSPAHDRIQPPPPQPPIHAAAIKPATSSRLQRIRPPPLAQLSNRPPHLLNCATNPSAFAGGFMRQTAAAPPHSPLPPLPSCHASAESPISAYMRFLHSSIAAVDSDPRFSNRTAFNPQQMLPPPPQQQHLPMNPPPLVSDSMPPPPSSPLPFGCLPSPKSPCPLLSPKLGFPQLPISPGVPSPKWRDL